MRMSAAYTELRIVLQTAYARIAVRMTHNDKQCTAEAEAGYVSKVTTTTGMPPTKSRHRCKLSHCIAEAAAGYISKIATTTACPRTKSGHRCKLSFISRVAAKSPDHIAVIHIQTKLLLLASINHQFNYLGSVCSNVSTLLQTFLPSMDMIPTTSMASAVTLAVSAVM